MHRFIILIKKKTVELNLLNLNLKKILTSNLHRKLR